uniref:Uncharacterized protein n=1 Tax=Chenopodium quinoa TaxID=63459 RepID=A0A803N940_CHEQI
MPKFVSAQSLFLRQRCSDTTYAPNNTYQSNLEAVLNSLSTDTRITYGFYNMTAGHEPDKVSSLALCRVMSLGYCSVFLSNRSIYGEVQNVVDTWLYADSSPVMNTRGFSDALSLLMQSLKNRAGFGNSEMKYAADKANTSGGQSLYGLVQCTPDLSKGSCMQCSQKLIDYFPSCCVQSDYTASGALLVLPNCFVQYDNNSFYGDVPNDPLPTSSLNISPSNNATTSGRKSKKTRIVGIVSIALGVSTMLLATSIIFRVLLKKRKLRKSWMVKFSKDEIEDIKSLQFSLGAMKQATQNFSEEYKLGEGGFGSVYKIADFGMARLFNFDQNQTQASKIVGTLGYISPEYALERQVSVKSDVYSFGVLVLEIVSGQRITSFFYDEDNQENLLSFAWRNWTEGNASNLVDPVIQPGSSTEILRCIHIGLLCVQDDPADRPTMSAVDLMLSSDSVTLQVPAQPAFCTKGQNLPDMLLECSTTTKSSVRSEGGSINNVSITELHPR